MPCFILAFISFSHMAFYIQKSVTNKNKATYYNILFLISWNTNSTLYLKKQQHIYIFANQAPFILSNIPMIPLQLTRGKYIIQGNITNWKILRINNTINWNLPLSISKYLFLFLISLNPIIHVSGLFPILEIAITSPYLTFNDQGPTQTLPSNMGLKSYQFQRKLKITSFSFILVMVQVTAQAHVYFKLFFPVHSPVLGRLTIVAVLQCGHWLDKGLESNPRRAHS